MFVLAKEGMNVTESERVSGKKINSFTGHAREITSLDYNPTDEFILSSSIDGYIKEWCRIKRTHINYRENENDAYVICSKFKSDDKHIISLSKPNNENYCIVNEWCRITQKPIRKHVVNNDAIIVNYSTKIKDEKKFITISDNNIVREWDLSNGEFIGVFGVYIEQCSFRNCIFIDNAIKNILDESGAFLYDCFLSEINIYSFDINLDYTGKNLILISQEEELHDCFIEIYRTLNGECNSENSEKLKFNVNGTVENLSEEILNYYKSGIVKIINNDCVYNCEVIINHLINNSRANKNIDVFIQATQNVLNDKSFNISFNHKDNSDDYKITFKERTTSSIYDLPYSYKIIIFIM